jgi:hypothetical protein
MIATDAHCGRPFQNPSNAKSLGEQIRDQSPARSQAIDPVFCSKYKMPLLQQPNCQRTSAAGLPLESQPRSVDGQRLNSTRAEPGHWPRDRAFLALPQASMAQACQQIANRQSYSSVLRRQGEQNVLTGPPLTDRETTRSVGRPRFYPRLSLSRSVSEITSGFLEEIACAASPHNEWISTQFRSV